MFPATAALLLCLPLAACSATTVAVTGSTGKLGRLAVQQLSAAGVATRCLLRHDAAAASPSIAADASAMHSLVP